MAAVARSRHDEYCPSRDDRLTNQPHATSRDHRFGTEKARCHTGATRLGLLLTASVRRTNRNLASSPASGRSCGLQPPRRRLLSGKPRLQSKSGFWAESRHRTRTRAGTAGTRQIPSALHPVSGVYVSDINLRFNPRHRTRILIGTAETSQMTSAQSVHQRLLSSTVHPNVTNLSCSLTSIHGGTNSA
jgi:hypothetical protein